MKKTKEEGRKEKAVTGVPPRFFVALPAESISFAAPKEIDERKGACASLSAQPSPARI